MRPVHVMSRWHAPFTYKHSDVRASPVPVLVFHWTRADSNMTCFTSGVFMFLLLALTSVLAYPWSDSAATTSLHRTECDTHDDTQILCQRCAKATKSNIVYPMCCEDKEEAKNWCFHYITFGIQGN